MGLLSFLFGQGQENILPQVQSIIPSQAENLIKSGTLPNFDTSTIMLGKDEKCHFIDRVIMVINVTKKMYKRRGGGSSIRIFRGFTIHNMDSTTIPEEYTNTKYTKGILYVTNKRIVFVSKENAFDKKISNLTSYIPYNNAISLQFGDKVYNLLLEKPELLIMILQIINDGGK